MNFKMAAVAAAVQPPATPTTITTTDHASVVTHILQHPPSTTDTLLVLGGVGILTLGGVIAASRTGLAPAPKDGFAGRKDLKRAGLTAKAVRTRANIIRPTAYGDASKSDLRKIDPRQVGGALGTTVRGASGVPLFTAYEHVRQLLAPPRIGKTAALASAVIDSVGPTIVTSMRPDIVEHTAGLRSLRGRLFCLNPDGQGHLPNTASWSPIDGCEDPRVAIQNAGYLIAGSSGAEGVTNRNFWEGSAFEVLRSYLHAAALGGKNMKDVWRWAQGGNAAEAAKILSYDDRAPAGWASSLDQTLTMGGKDGVTRDSILKTLSLALGFMADPIVAEIVCPAEDQRMDLDAFLTSSGDTLYLLGTDRPHSSIAPVFVGLLGALYERARTLASFMRGGRIDPIVSFLLDEACNICPVPLERWVTTSGGAGIHVSYVIQSIHQLVDRYGHASAKVIQTGATVKLTFGGVDDVDYLKELSLLCGPRWKTDTSSSTNRDGSVSTHHKKIEVPAITEVEIKQLPDFQALVTGGNRKATVVLFVPVWKRKDVKARNKDMAKHGVTVADLIRTGPSWTPPQTPGGPQ
jgi:type IV secretion system protein VirD4